MKKHLIPFLILATLGLYSCSSMPDIPYIYETEEERYEPHSSTSELRPADRGPIPPTKVSLAKRMPWETWPFGRDLNGTQLSNAYIVQGDEYLRNDARSKALDFYKKANKAVMTPEEQEAVAIRISSVLLSLDKSKQALDNLSRYFKTSNRSVDDVDSRFSLLFGYAYGRNGNIEQSIAWFSRANRLEAGRGGMAQSADKGLEMLLKSLTDEQFNNLDAGWSTDNFVSTAIGQERRRRSHRSYAPQTTASNNPFWQEGMGMGFQSAVTPVRSGQTTTVGVLLPLSGKYGALGKSTLNGIKIAEKARGQESGVELVSKNTEGQPITAAAFARELVTVNKASVFLGPLLAEPSAEVGRAIAGSGAPVLSFSKKTDFQFAKGTFRLGPTTQSQVHSLVEKTVRGLNIKRFGVLYPQTELGMEYASFFRQSVRDNGGTLLYDSAFYPKDTGGFIKAADEIMTQGVEAIFIPDSIRIAAAFVTNIPEDKRRNLRVLGPASWDNPTQLNRSRALLSGAIFVSPFFAKSERPIIKRFQESYRHYYKKSPDFLAAQGFDAATLMFAAIDRAQSDRVSVEAAMNSIDLYEGLTGEISVDANGNLRRRFSIVEVTDKGLKELHENLSVSIGTKEPTPYYRMDGNTDMTGANMGAPGLEQVSSIR